MSATTTTAAVLNSMNNLTSTLTRVAITRSITVPVSTDCACRCPSIPTSLPTSTPAPADITMQTFLIGFVIFYVPITVIAFVFLVPFICRKWVGECFFLFRFFLCVCVYMQVCARHVTIHTSLSMSNRPIVVYDIWYNIYYTYIISHFCFFCTCCLLSLIHFSSAIFILSDHT